MTETIELQIFVSCPKDVEKEKDIVESVCKDLMESARNYCNVRFVVREWKTIVGSFGERPQEIINSKIKDYDIYFGILWMRFGSNTGKTNPNTGEEFESGTHEEFVLAYENWNLHKIPTIYIFAKNPQATNNSKETKQLLKVQEFIDEQKQNGWVNPFHNEFDFQSKVYKVLNEKLFSLCFSEKIEQKSNVLEKLPKDRIEEFKNSIESTPPEYISRSTSHFRAFIDKQNVPFLEVEKQSLDQLMITNSRIVLLGDAGSGKTTELRNLYHKLNRDESPFIPILQNFNSYTPDLGIEVFLPALWKIIPNNLLLIIWDGLDEIQPEHFNTVIRQIYSFSTKYIDIRILISCRTNFYEFPVNNSSGTLPGFEPYIINDLSSKDISYYYQIKYSASTTDDFISEVSNVNVGDLITKPFYLMLLAENFAREKKLSINRAKLYELFLMNRIEFDQKHFNTTIDIRSKKQDIIKLLQKVALSMEILSKNQIKESEVLELIRSDEFILLKYCTAFKKKDGEEDTWQFEHNNIQEFLAAKALSSLEFAKVIKFLTFEPNHKKLIPSWVNTLALLFSILKVGDELFQQLLEWMLKNEKEIIVKFEQDKIPEDLRIRIFQEIFNHYKEHDVWISSNKFSNKEFARFGQSETNLRFLIDELKNEENTRTVNINAIRLLGHFEFSDVNTKHEIEDLLLNHIKNNIKDPNFIHTTINSLKWARLNGKNIIDKLMKMVGDRKNQYIRAAMYAILLKSDVLEENVYYLIEGYELTEKKTSEDRSDVSLIDERWNLKECVKSIKSPKGIKKIADYITESTRFEHGYDTGKVIETIISNAVDAYGKDITVFDSILSWFLKDIRAIRMEKINLVLSFFEHTNTREKAFYQIWESKEDKERNKSLAIAKLITTELMQFVIDEYLSRNITNRELENIYFNMSWVGNKARGKFEELILEKTDFEIKKPEQIDYELIQKKKLWQDFNLLFDKSGFKKETLRVFEEQIKDVLSFDELFEIRKENDQWVEIEEYYSGVALRLLRDFVNKGQTVSKEKVVSWFEKEEEEKWYRVSLVYEYLTNHKEIEINKEQKQWIISWCKENITKVNFKKAIEVYEDGRITYKTMEMYIWYFSRRCDIDHPKDVLIDMLSFDFYEGNDRVGMEYLKSKLNTEDIINQMLRNIEDGISDDSVLKNHITYLVQNKVEQSYPFILGEIVNTKRRDYHRRAFLDIFFEFTKSTQSLKTILDKADSSIKWEIIDKLKTNNEEHFVEKYLLEEINKDIDSAEKGKVAEVLVTLQNLEGLKIYVDWIKNNAGSDIELSRAMSLNSLKIKDAIPYLMELLELSYLKEIKVDRFDRFNSLVIGALENVALVSEKNYMQVKSSLEKFMSEKSSINDDIKHLLYTIERLEDQFYMNRVPSYTINQVKEKLKLIE